MKNPITSDPKWELLDYPNPLGIHPIEESWRDYARKLKQILLELQKTLIAGSDGINGDWTVEELKQFFDAIL